MQKPADIQSKFVIRLILNLDITVNCLGLLFISSLSHIEFFFNLSAYRKVHSHSQAAFLSMCISSCTYLFNV
jgi:hypothetical protein